MNLESLEISDPDIARAIAEEAARQESTLEMIASENITSPRCYGCPGQHAHQ